MISIPAADGAGRTVGSQGGWRESGLRLHGRSGAAPAAGCHHCCLCQLASVVNSHPRLPLQLQLLEKQPAPLPAAAAAVAAAAGAAAGGAVAAAGAPTRPRCSQCGCYLGGCCAWGRSVKAAVPAAAVQRMWGGRSLVPLDGPLGGNLCHLDRRLDGLPGVAAGGGDGAAVRVVARGEGVEVAVQMVWGLEGGELAGMGAVVERAAVVGAGEGVSEVWRRGWGA
eukprot:313930-Pelagomonas_calceolata.AAC.6